MIDGAPSAYGNLVGSLPTNVKITTRPKPPVHVFATRAAGLAGKLRGYRSAVTPDGSMIRVSWPKKSSGLATDLTDVVVRNTTRALDLVDIKVCALHEVWSGLKFVTPKERR